MGPAAKDAVSALANVLQQDKDIGVRAAAASALSRIGPVDAIPAIIELLPDYPPTPRPDPAQTLVNIAKAMQDAGTVDSIPALKRAQIALEKAGDRMDAADVRRAIEKLERDRNEQFSARLRRFGEWVKVNPGAAAGLSLSLVYCAWFLVLRLAILHSKPLLLFHWNETLQGLDYKLPKWLGEATISMRWVVLIGFYQYHPRVLDAWVSSHVSRAREMLHSGMAIRDRTQSYSAAEGHLSTQGVQQNQMIPYVALPVRLKGKILGELKPEDLQVACADNRWRLLIKGEGGLGKTTLAKRIAQWGLAENSSERLCPDRQMLPVFLDAGIKFDVRKDLTTFKT
jgi:hypothetical protein